MREKKSKEWPKAPNKLPGRLRREATFLRQVGIKIVERREGKAGTKMIYISVSEEKEGDLPSEPSEPSANRNGRLSANDLVADDGADDTPWNADDNEIAIVSHNPLENRTTDDADGTDDKIHSLSLCAYCRRPCEREVWIAGEKVYLHHHCDRAWSNGR